MSIKQEILKNTGLNEEVLEEGIFFFKNSKKINRLAGKLEKKAEKLFKKGDISGSRELYKFLNEARGIATRFENLENQFSFFMNKENKELLKKKYNDLSLEFSKLLGIAKNEAFKSAALKVGGLAIVAAIIFAGGIFLTNLEFQHKTFSFAKENIAARFMKRRPAGPGVAGAVTSTMDRLSADAVIRRTNDDLLSASVGVGATVAGAIGGNALMRMKRYKLENKTMNDTVRTLEDLKSYEEKTKGEMDVI